MGLLNALCFVCGDGWGIRSVTRGALAPFVEDDGALTPRWQIDREFSPLFSSSFQAYRCPAAAFWLSLEPSSQSPALAASAEFPPLAAASLVAVVARRQPLPLTYPVF